MALIALPLPASGHTRPAGLLGGRSAFLPRKVATATLGTEA